MVIENNNRKILFFLILIPVLILIVEFGYYLYLTKIKTKNINLNNPKVEIATNTVPKPNKETQLTDNEQRIFNICGKGKNIDTAGFLIRATFISVDMVNKKTEVTCNQQKVTVIFDQSTIFNLINEDEPHASDASNIVKEEQFFNYVKPDAILQINIKEVNNAFVANSIVAMMNN